MSCVCQLNERVVLANFFGSFLLPPVFAKILVGGGGGVGRTFRNEDGARGWRDGPTQPASKHSLPTKAHTTHSTIHSFILNSIQQLASGQRAIIHIHPNCSCSRQLAVSTLLLFMMRMCFPFPAISMLYAHIHQIFHPSIVAVAVLVPCPLFKKESNGKRFVHSLCVFPTDRHPPFHKCPFFAVAATVSSGEPSTAPFFYSSFTTSPNE